MGSKFKIGLTDIKTVKDDGTRFSRLEMEEQLRKETVHHRRLRAAKLGLPNKTAQHMLPISITHWLLDYWVQNGTITGEILGISSEFDADDNKDYLRQLTQRLAQFVEHGLAIKPNLGEGIDMSQFQMPPGFPPPPPMMPPGPGTPVVGVVAPAPGVFSPPMPPNQMPPMMQPPTQFTPPMPGNFPQPPPAPVAIQAPQAAQSASGQPPTKADPSRVWGQAGKREDGTQRTRRTKEEVAEDAAYTAWCGAGGDPNIGATVQATPSQPVAQAPAPQMPPQVPNHQFTAAPAAPPMVMPPNPFAAQMPAQAPQAAPVVNQQPQISQPVTTTSEIDLKAVNQLREELVTIDKRFQRIEMGIAQVLRVLYNGRGGETVEADLAAVLSKVCGLNPQ